MTTTAPLLAPELARAVALQRDRLDPDPLSRAYRMSAQAHLGQKRQSGDDYVSHSVAVATILAEQQMDSVTIAAALLHDVVEDSNVSVEDIRTTFGPEVAELVDGLTKLSTLTFRSTVQEQAEKYRKPPHPARRRAAGCRTHRLRDHRPPQEPLVDLQEDEEARQAVRGDL